MPLLTALGAQAIAGLLVFGGGFALSGGAIFSPPLIITRGQIDDMFDILGRAIEILARETGEG